MGLAEDLDRIWAALEAVRDVAERLDLALTGRARLDWLYPLQDALGVYGDNVFDALSRIDDALFPKKTDKKKCGVKRFGERPEDLAAYEMICELVQKYPHDGRYRWTRIANEMNALGIKTRYGRKWTGVGLRRMFDRIRPRSHKQEPM